MTDIDVGFDGCTWFRPDMLKVTVEVFGNMDIYVSNIYILGI